MIKILKYIVFTLLALILIYVAIGLFNKSVSYGHEVTVNKPVEEAWAVALDEAKYHEWLAGFKSITLIEGEKGTVGSKYKVIVNPGHDQPDFEMIETVISFKENEHVELHFDNEMMDFEQTMTFSETDGKTTIKTDSKAMGKSVMTRSMFTLMESLAGGFTSQETKNIEALKKVIEENETVY